MDIGSVIAKIVEMVWKCSVENIEWTRSVKRTLLYSVMSLLLDSQLSEIFIWRITLKCTCMVDQMISLPSGRKSSNMDAWYQVNIFLWDSRFIVGRWCIYFSNLATRYAIYKDSLIISKTCNLEEYLPAGILPMLKVK